VFLLVSLGMAGFEMKRYLDDPQYARFVDRIRDLSENIPERRSASDRRAGADRRAGIDRRELLDRRALA
jgi:hypothetical protein